MWLDTTGETPLTSVRRSLLELSKDALLLGQSVTAVAERAAYASGQAFAHAFHRQFGRSARSFVQTRTRLDGPSDFKIFDIADPIPLVTADISATTPMSANSPPPAWSICARC